MQDDWREKAKCRALEQPVNFFPDPTDIEGIEAATSVCQGCPVRQQCERLALDFPDTVGVFGGDFYELKEDDETGTA